MSRQSPSARTTAWLEAQGYTVERVEQRLTRVVTKDFMGFADLLAVKEEIRGVLAIQATDTSNLSKRVAKVMAEPKVTTWLRSGNRAWCVSWAERGPEAAWTVKVVQITLAGPRCDGAPYKIGPRKVIIPA